MDFAPGAALGIAMFANFPFAFAEHLQAGAVDDQVQRLTLTGDSPRAQRPKSRKKERNIDLS